MFLEQRVEQLEKELSELKVIVHELRKPSTVIKSVTVTTPVEDTIEFEGKRYKKVDREACEGDAVVLTGDNLPNWFTKGKMYAINERGKIAHADDGTTNYEVHDRRYGRTPETVDVYELIVEDKPKIEGVTIELDKPKTANELRAEIIEKAKAFVESKINGGEQVIPDGNGGQWFLRSFDFVVNEAKRTIVVLCKSYTGRIVLKRSIAKCMPGDVFNEHIGKAIALGRALNIDVSEFEQAAQPTFAIGQRCVIKNWDGHNGKALTLTKVFDNGKKVNHTHGSGYLTDCELTIINDTNAIYGGAKQ